MTSSAAPLYTSRAFESMFRVDDAFLPKLVAHLVADKDYASLSECTASSVLHPGANRELVFAVLPLEQRDEPEAQQLFAEWMRKAGALDTERLGLELHELAAETTRGWSVEIGRKAARLLRLGAEYASAPRRRRTTPLGAVILNGDATVRPIGTEIIKFAAQQHPDRLPMATNKLNVLEYLVARGFYWSGHATYIKEIAEFYDCKRPEIHAATNAAFECMLDAGLVKSSTSECLINALTFISLGFTSAESARRFWSMTLARKANGDGTYTNDALGYDENCMTMGEALARMSSRWNGSTSDDRRRAACAAIPALVRAGIDLNGETDFRRLPLTAAIRYGHPDLISTLLDCGASMEPLVDWLRTGEDVILDPLAKPIVAAALARASMSSALRGVLSDGGQRVQRLAA